ncbi:peptidase inhibitor family I36 protein [Kitasatospora sp. NPDC056327]|uniref:peptidase inhibitor family I36 protein n=1 Tax=Kitasatospora sp. NPDC056327 TaxID=3345785 RepID=UPI0035DF9A35
MNRVIGAATAAAALAFLLGSAPAARAEDNPPGCPKGYFCIYSGENQTGTLLKKTNVDWSAGSPSEFVTGARSVFNNGTPCAGCDHVRYLYYPGIGNNMTLCLHYNPGPGKYKQNWSFPVVVKSAHWGGEC